MTKTPMLRIFLIACAMSLALFSVGADAQSSSPRIADYTGTWKSDKGEIFTVRQNGLNFSFTRTRIGRTYTGRATMRQFNIFYTPSSADLPTTWRDPKTDEIWSLNRNDHRTIIASGYRKFARIKMIEDAQGPVLLVYPGRTKLALKRASPGGPVSVVSKQASLKSKPIQLRLSPKLVCGPDITSYVFKVIDEIHKDWRNWGTQLRTLQCRTIYNVVTGLNAWDIGKLDPLSAAVPKGKFQQMADANKTYGTIPGIAKYSSHADYMKKNDFFFEGYGHWCPRPRSTCMATVTFLGQCMHAQQVNYVQWGVMANLCNSLKLANSLHAARGMVKDTNWHTIAGQQVAVELGWEYSRMTDSGAVKRRRPSGPGSAAAMEARLKRWMAEKMAKISKAPANAAFATRPEAKCAMACTLPPAGKAAIDSLPLRYKWGLSWNQ